MIKLRFVNIPQLLEKKYLQWQLNSEARKTLDDFANYIGVKRPLLSMWMTGKRHPGEQYKARLVELFGDEAILSFDEDPDLHAVQKSWEYIPPEQRRELRDKAEKYASENVERTSKKRRTSTAK